MSATDSDASVESSSQMSVEPLELCPQYLKDKGFSVGSAIGGGAFCTVYKASQRIISWDKKLAVKLMTLNQAPREWRHHNLKDLMSIVNRFKERTLADNGSLSQYLRQQDQPLTESKARSWFDQLTRALYYLHSHSVVHLNVKTSSILLDSQWSVKLAGFKNLTRTFDVKNKRSVLCEHSVRGGYQAPEVSQPPYKGESADVYSSGVVLYELISGRKPFGESLAARRELNWIPETGRFTSDSAKMLMITLLYPDPEERPTTSHILRHPWFTIPIDCL